MTLKNMKKFIKTQYHLNSLERTFFVRKCCYDIAIIKRSGAVIFDWTTWLIKDSLLSVIDRSIKSFDQFQFAEASFQRWQQSRGKLVRFEVRCTHSDTIQINESLEDSSESLEPY